jgi:hypothetical protein
MGCCCTEKPFGLGLGIRDRETIDSRREGTWGWGVPGEFRRPKAEDVRASDPPPPRPDSKAEILSPSLS